MIEARKLVWWVLIYLPIIILLFLHEMVEEGKSVAETIIIIATASLLAFLLTKWWSFCLLKMKGDEKGG